MKTIITGVDFSASSYNAAKYAAMLAQKLNYKLILFNMYEVPLLHSNSGLYFMPSDSIREESVNGTDLFCKKLRKLYPKIEIGAFVSTGFFKQQLTNFIKTHQVKLVVMGITTKNKFSKFLYGSHSTEIAGKINVPVIVVPDNFKKHRLHKVLLGVDNKEKLHKSSLTAFENFVKETKAITNLLHVQTEDEIFVDKTQTTIKLNGKNQKIVSCPYSTFESGISAYAKEKEVDLITIISKKHSAFYNLFNESNTKKIASTSKIPIMAIHE
jgi:nucleotide-binding universal stress UspA family protein